MTISSSKYVFFFCCGALILLLTDSADAQGAGTVTVCQVVDEYGGSMNMQCPPGLAISAITFASYGLPQPPLNSYPRNPDDTPVCSAMTYDPCHSAVSLNIAESACLGKSLCTITNSNSAAPGGGGFNSYFGDPCQNVVKRLYVRALCSDPNTCASLTSCGTCVNNLNIEGCGWCIQDGTCRSAQGNCPSNLYYAPTSSVTERTPETPSGDVWPASSKVALRYNIPLEVPITINVPTRKPIDLHILYDVSSSMSDDLVQLRTLAASTLRDSINKNCNAGTPPSPGEECAFIRLSTFVDKPLSPLGGASDWVFKSAAGYTSNFDFSSNTATLHSAFQSETASTITSTTRRTGLLEAALQAALCSNWDPAHRHILFIATDRSVHFQGDGATTTLGREAIYKNAQFQCNAGPGSELASKTYDYPSIGQLTAAFQLNNVFPVFAATNTVENAIYDSIINLIGYGRRENIAVNSNNFLSIFDSAHASIASTVIARVKDSNVARFVKSIAPATATTVTPGNSIQFIVTLEANAGTVSVDTTEEDLEIVFLGLGSALVTVSLVDCNTQLCADACLSAACNVTGAITCDCGKCQCRDEWTGTQCSCLRTENNKPCPVVNGAECSGRGRCLCGRCQCDIGFTGNTCNCPDTPCPSNSTGAECSGHGSCNCGNCVCAVSEDEIWLGSACQCSSATSEGGDCPLGANGQECAGNGVCNRAIFPEAGICNGVCECNSPWIGESCECNTVCLGGCNEGCAEVAGGCGQCECGQCVCANGYDPATNCRCPINSAASCPRDSAGVICGGPGHFTDCDCGVCTCTIEYTGNACDCSSRPCIENCNAPNNGECVCGECVCSSEYTGSTCACFANTTCPLGANGEQCSGRGRCITDSASQCGECECDPGFGGEACQCSVQACPVELIDGIQKRCSGNGECNECGICVCNEDTVGEDCSCNKNEHPCPANTEGAPCSGHGECLHEDSDTCGVCLCDRDPFTEVFLYGGANCNCSIRGCPIIGGRPCGEHGQCGECSICQCDAGWTGSDCTCKVDACPIINGKECAGHGTCGCFGVCECEVGWYQNCIFCDENILGDECPGAFCSNLTTCTSCLEESACTWCRSRNICVYNESAAGCASVVEQGGVCDPKNELSNEVKAGIAGGVAGALILIALLALVIIKLLQIRADKRDWARFEKEKAKARWKGDDNPLFKSSVANYDNPLYKDASAQ